MVNEASKIMALSAARAYGIRTRYLVVNSLGGVEGGGPSLECAERIRRKAEEDHRTNPYWKGLDWHCEIEEV